MVGVRKVRMPKGTNNNKLELFVDLEGLGAKFMGMKWVCGYEVLGELIYVGCWDFFDF